VRHAGDVPQRWFLAWLVVGVAWMFVLLGAMTIGILLVPLALTGTILLARHRSAAIGAYGLVSGLGLPFLFVAYLNRDGPGEVCRTVRSGSRCTEEWSPWPWFAIGALLLLGGVALFRRRVLDVPTLDA
jgi:MYXO-CTERM domain-containing protein